MPSLTLRVSVVSDRGQYSLTRVQDIWMAWLLACVMKTRGCVATIPWSRNRPVVGLPRECTGMVATARPAARFARVRS